MPDLSSVRYGKNPPSGTIKKPLFSGIAEYSSSSKSIFLKSDTDMSTSIKAGSDQKEMDRKSPSRTLRRTSLRRPSKSASATTQLRSAIPPDDKMIFEMEDLPDVPVNALGGAGSPDYRPSPSSSPVLVILDSEIDISDEVEDGVSDIPTPDSTRGHAMEKAKKRKAVNIDAASASSNL